MIIGRRPDEKNDDKKQSINKKGYKNLINFIVFIFFEVNMFSVRILFFMNRKC